MTKWFFYHRHKLPDQEPRYDADWLPISILAFFIILIILAFI